MSFYTKTTWVNGSSPALNAANLNNIENGIDSVTKKCLNNEKGVNELLMLAEIDSKIIGDNNLGKYYAKAGETFSYSSGDIDFTKAYCASATQGTNTITVTSMIVGAITDFTAGMEVTLQDGSNKEVLTVSSVSDPTITFTGNIVNSYAGSVNVYRSNITDSGAEFDFGTLTTQTSYDRTTPVQVVNSAYSTAGNGGRKLVRLSNGNLIALTLDSSGSDIYLYKSEDNGGTWSRLCYMLSTNLANPSMTSTGNIINVIATVSTVSVVHWDIDTTTVTDTDIYSQNNTIDGSQTALGATSITTASNGDLHAAWASKNATYSNSFNIRYSKSTDGGATWATVESLLTDNTSGTDNTTPCIVIMSNGYPCVAYRRVASGNNFINVRVYTGSSWNGHTVHLGTTYTQSNPCATVTSDGDIHVVWEGTDVTDTTKQNIRYSKSTDNGANWSAELKLTSGNVYAQQYASITIDDSDNLYVVFCGQSSASSSQFRIRSVEYTGSWSSAVDITSNTTGHNFRPQTCENFNEFTEPLFIFEDDVNSDIKFYGEWTAIGESDTLTEVDVRMNITPKVDSENLSAFLYFNDAYSSITAKASIVDSTANESYSAMTSSDVDLGTDLNEKTSTISVATAEDRVTLKYELARTLTTDDAEFIKVYGGID